MLDHDETMKLILLAQNGDNEAKTVLLNENKPLIKSIIRRYTGKGVEYEDLMQIASVGFLKAVANFKDEFSVRFSTYAVPMILGEVKRFMRDDGYIKVSRSTKALSAKIYRYIEETLRLEGKEPTLEELAEKFGEEKTEIVFALDARKQPCSIYDRTEEDEQGICLIDKLSEGSKEDNVIDRLILRSVISELSEREKKIILLRYYRDMTQSEIAQRLGVSQVQISRLENKIIDKIRGRFSD